MKVCAEANRRKTEAGEMLIHYFTVAIGGHNMKPDMRSEIQSIVDMIFDAAVMQARAERKEATGA